MNRTQILTMCWGFNIVAVIPFIIRDNVALYILFMSASFYLSTIPQYDYQMVLLLYRYDQGQHHHLFNP